MKKFSLLYLTSSITLSLISGCSSNSTSSESTPDIQTSCICTDSMPFEPKTEILQSSTQTSNINIYSLKPAEENGDSYLTEILALNGLSYTDISESSQLIIVDSNGSDCEVYLYEKNNKIWKSIHNFSGVVGKNGVSANKSEGDYCTPKGMYSLGFGFGTELIETKIEYRIINENCYWVDDSKSKYYNQWKETEVIDWESAEHLIDYPVSYHYGVVINYNLNPTVPERGSAIFLHCFAGNYTAGCVAVPEENMVCIMHWLNEKLNPCIIIN